MILKLTYCTAKTLIDIVPFCEDDEIISVESLQFNFSTINVATNNFSNGNTLGRGGFGDVYKVKYICKLKH